MSATARKRKEEVAQALRKLIQAKGKTPAMKYQQLLDDLRGQSETVRFFSFFQAAPEMYHADNCCICENNFFLLLN